MSGRQHTVFSSRGRTWLLDAYQGSIFWLNKKLFDKDVQSGSELTNTRQALQMLQRDFKLERMVVRKLGVVDSRVTNLGLKTLGSQPFDLERVLAASFCSFFQAQPPRALGSLLGLPSGARLPWALKMQAVLGREAWCLPSSGHTRELPISTSPVHLPQPQQSPLLPLPCSKPNVGSLVRTLPARLTRPTCQS